jgi:ABC-type molybdate transport system substrate-binding protein
MRFNVFPAQLRAGRFWRLFSFFISSLPMAFAQEAAGDAAAEARAFIQYISSADARNVWKAKGFDAP